MMMPSLTSSSSTSSSSALVVRVEKATSEFLIGPDWTLNIDICDTINSNQWLAKDAVKTVKKRLQHKNPKVHLLALTLLETMVKNCGDYVHFQIVERTVLQEMIKIVKKKSDLHVRDKILVLLDSWQEAFGGPGGKYPQYYWAYEELRRSGVQFPQRTYDSAPIFTPPVSHPISRHPQPGYGMPSNSSTRLDEAMAAEMETLSLSVINSMRDVLDLLADMLQAIDPTDRMAVKDEVIIDLVDRCRANQKKLMHMLTTTADEELLSHGLELNDTLQNVLAKHDSIASGVALPTQTTNINSQTAVPPDSKARPSETKAPSKTLDAQTLSPHTTVARGQIDEDEEEEDDFAQLARRHSKTQAAASTTAGTSDRVNAVINSSNYASPEPSSPIVSNALVVVDPPAPVKTSQEQDIIDLLSITLVTNTMSDEAPRTSASPAENKYQEPVSSGAQGNPYASQANHSHQTINSYIAPWAQPQSQPQLQSETQVQTIPQSHHHHQQQPQPYLQPQVYEPPSHSQHPPQPQPLHQHQSQPYGQPQFQLQQQQQHLPQTQSQASQFSNYPPPPWAATPGYFSNPNPQSRSPYSHTAPTAATTSSMPLQLARPLQHVNSFPRASSGLASNGDARGSPHAMPNSPAAGQKPFVPSYRLFEDLDVFGNADGRFKTTNNPSPRLSGTNTSSILGGRK